MIPNLPQREEYLQKKRKRKILKYLIIFSSLIIIIGLVSYVSHRQSIRISKIELTGGVLVTEKDVEEKTLEYLKGSYFLLFPKNNSFWYPNQSLKKYLKDSFKRIDTIDLNLKNFYVLSVNITERQPIATWCSKSPNEDIIIEDGTKFLERCYFIDQNSTIFAEAPNFSGDAYFKYYGEVSNENPIGLEYMASSTKFGEINQFVNLVKNLKIKPLYVVAKDNDEFSLVLFGGGEIYFDVKRPLEGVVGNLETLLLTPTFSKGLNNLDYIDLRYGNKLFYKLKE